MFHLDRSRRHLLDGRIRMFVSWKRTNEATCARRMVWPSARRGGCRPAAKPESDQTDSNHVVVYHGAVLGTTKGYLLGSMLQEGVDVDDASSY